jgi:acyl-CoA hydrolase
VGEHWREEYARKLTTPAEAVRRITPGQRIAIPVGATPVALAEALAERADELADVEIVHCASAADYPWFEPAWRGPFRVTHEHYAAPVARRQLAARDADYVPLLFSRRFRADEEGRSDEEGRPTDVVFLEVSPPDDHGYCYIGSHWTQKGYAERARVVLGEVNPFVPRCYGDTAIHVSAFDAFVEFEGVRPRLREADLNEQTRVIAGYVGTLVRDGDTLQIGAGNTSRGIAFCGVFDDRIDLGWHSEATPSAVVHLIEAGIINGRRKTLNAGKAVSCAFYGGPEEMSIVDRNPRFEVQSCAYVHDVRTIAAHDNLVAINNALAVDVTGQIAADSIGHRLVGGTGGQLEFAMGAAFSRGGRFITVLPSTTGDGRSRIVVGLEPGTVVTVPRNLADIVVTEYGIARLWGKSVRERAEELISIAHPEHRVTLREHVRRLFYP